MTDPKGRALKGVADCALTKPRSVNPITPKKNSGVSPAENNYKKNKTQSTEVPCLAHYITKPHYMVLHHVAIIENFSTIFFQFSAIARGQRV